MSKEVINIPEEDVPAVVKIIRSGFRHTENSEETLRAGTLLSKWCDSVEPNPTSICNV